MMKVQHERCYCRSECHTWGVAHDEKGDNKEGRSWWGDHPMRREVDAGDFLMRRMVDEEWSSQWGIPQWEVTQKKWKCWGSSHQFLLRQLMEEPSLLQFCMCISQVMRQGKILLYFDQVHAGETWEILLYVLIHMVRPKQYSSRFNSHMVRPKQYSGIDSIGTLFGWQATVLIFYLGAIKQFT
jgi:hypothetical protein